MSSSIAFILWLCKLLMNCSAKLYEIGAGTTEVRKIVIGRAFNKEYSSYAS